MQQVITNLAYALSMLAIISVLAVMLFGAIFILSACFVAKRKMPPPPKHLYYCDECGSELGEPDIEGYYIGPGNQWRTRYSSLCFMCRKKGLHHAH